MKHFICTLCAVVLVAVTSSCASLPEPVSGGTLLIGRFTVVERPRYPLGPAKLTMKFLNTESRVYYTVTAGRDGYFCTAELPAGEYRLAEFSVMGRAGGFRAPVHGDPCIILGPDSVSNMGTFMWDENSDSILVPYTVNTGYMRVFDRFGKKLKSGPWSARVVTDVRVIPRYTVF